LQAFTHDSHSTNRTRVFVDSVLIIYALACLKHRSKFIHNADVGISPRFLCKRRPKGYADSPSRQSLASKGFVLLIDSKLQYVTYLKRLRKL